MQLTTTRGRKIIKRILTTFGAVVFVFAVMLVFISVNTGNAPAPDPPPAETSVPTVEPTAAPTPEPPERDEPFYFEIDHPCFWGYEQGFEHLEPDAAGICPRCLWYIGAPEFTEDKPTPEADETPRHFNIPLCPEIQDFIYDISESNEHITPLLLFALIERESGYRTAVISTTNDYGLMQINKSNHSWLRRDLGIDCFLDPFDSIRAGVHILQMYVDRGITDPHKLLMCYRHNQGGASSMWERGIYETHYTRDIIAIMQRIEQNSNESGAG